MTAALHTSTELHAGDATVTVRCDDGSACRLELRTGDGSASARSAGLLVRQAVRDGARRGVRSVALTLDVSSPACGAVLGQLRDLAREGVGSLQWRAAGGTVLVDVDLSSAPTEDATAPSPQPTLARPVEARRAVSTTTPRREPRDAAPSMNAARRAQRRLRTQLAGRSGVCGVGLARHGDGYAIRVNVVDRSVVVPAEVDGLPVDIRVTGPLTALPRGL